MMDIRVRMGAVMLAGALALTGTAASAGGPDLHAAAAIRSGNYALAESILVKEQSGRWTAPETLLNLAHVYRRTGRDDAAVALYDRVLSDANVLLNVGATRPIWSHDVARAARDQIAAPATTMAAR